MSAPAVITAADLRFCNLVAVRRRGADLQDPNATSLDEAVAWPLAEQDGVPRFRTPFQRAAALAESTLKVFEAQPMVTALLAVVAQLRLERYQLIAPQGVFAGMIEGLQRGRTSVDEMAYWLEDRSINLI